MGGAVQMKEEVQKIRGNLLCVTQACLHKFLIPSQVERRQPSNWTGAMESKLGTVLGILWVQICCELCSPKSF